MIVTPQQMSATERVAFEAGVEAEPLMEKAGLGIARAVIQFCPDPGTVIGFVAKGHNGGDALVAARHLRAAGWEVVLRFVGEPEALKPLTRRKLEALDGGYEFLPARTNASVPHVLAELVPGRPVILLDGILGIGAEGALTGEYRAAAEHLNHLRRDLQATTFAIDIPTGVDGTSGDPDPHAVVADITVTIAQVKSGLLSDAAIDHVGRLVVVPLPELDPPVEGDDRQVALTSRLGRGFLAMRGFDTHKGDAGRIGVVAGSRGFLGAAALASAGAVRAGGGLVTLYVPEDAYEIVAALTIPEVMVKAVGSCLEVLDDRPDVLAIGPGLGPARRDGVPALVREATGPLVVDADGLNALAAADALGLLDERDGPTLLTPHPGEMRRLLGGRDPGDRRRCARAFAEAHPSTVLLLKGARTVVAARRRPLALNTTGNPGMASGGMGDVLTGICGALAHGARSTGRLWEVACLGAWITGRAAERAVASGAASHESLAATDVLRELGGAFQDLRRGVF